MDDAAGIDDEGGPFGHASHGEILVGEEAVVGRPVGLGDLVFIVAEEGDADAFLFGPGGLGERVVTADAEDLGAEGFVFVEALGDGTEFVGADAGERYREEEQEVLDMGIDVLGQLLLPELDASSGGEAQNYTPLDSPRSLPA